MHVKDIKIFLKKKKRKKFQHHRDRNKNLSGEEKQKKVEYMRNYYLAHKKTIFGVLQSSLEIEDT